MQRNVADGMFRREAQRRWHPEALSGRLALTISWLYTWGMFPSSQFRMASWDLMCQDSTYVYFRMYARQEQMYSTQRSDLRNVYRVKRKL